MEIKGIKYKAIEQLASICYSRLWLSFTVFLFVCLFLNKISILQGKAKKKLPSQGHFWGIGFLASISS